MPYYIFDAHSDGSAEWGDESIECEGHDEIERHARRLIDEVQERQGEPPHPLTTVFVHQDGDGIVLTAYARPGQDVKLVWTPE